LSMGDTIGLIYDFDHTLSEEYQQFPFLREYAAAIEEKHGLTRPEDYFPILCDDIDIGIGAMQQMLLDVVDVYPGLTNDKMRDVYGPKIELSPGLPDWFDRINDYASSLELEVEHHIISAGCQPLVEGTAIAAYATSIRAGLFLENGKQIDRIKSIVDPNNKREEIIKICKGQTLEEDLDFQSYHINYNRVMVFGDGQSDRRKFNFTRERGGGAVGVYKKGDDASRSKAEQILGGRVHHIVPRDYSEDSPMETVVKGWLHLVSERTCSFDYRMIHALNLGQLRNEGLMDLTRGHLEGCTDCQTRSEDTKIL
jgi:hypothetical protein